MKTAIVYYSKHHGNTEKLVQAICRAHEDVEAINILNGEKKDLSRYELVGVASGIYGGNFSKNVMNYLNENLKAGQKVFLLYTYAMKMDHYTNSVRKTLIEKSADIVGEYGCQGYNTFGPFKIVGGTAKGHPTEEEISGAVKFYEGLL